LGYLGHALSDYYHCLVIDSRAGAADGNAERDIVAATVLGDVARPTCA
jgi:hypothetical protein